jgi:hypothetical protein
MSDRPAQMGQFEPIMGRWKGQADFELDPSMHIEGKSCHEWLGEHLKIRSHAEDPVASSISGSAAGRTCRAPTSRPGAEGALSMRARSPVRGSLSGTGLRAVREYRRSERHSGYPHHGNDLTRRHGYG